jgi:branched-subunit amino acid ABC-type transport system permease component
MNTEPVAIVGGLTQIVSAVIALLIGFDIVSWTPEQTGLVLGVWAAITAFALVFFVRSKVTPTS